MSVNIATKICKYVCVEKSLHITGMTLSGISISDGLVTAKMVPADYEMGGIVATKLIKLVKIDPETGEYCYKSALHHIWWYRGKFDDFPIIVNTLIDSCRISGYEISAFGTDLTPDGRLILFSFFSLQIGDINDEDGILQYNPDTELEHQQLQNQIVPGEDVVLSIWLTPKPPASELEERWAGHVWWGTDYLSGGRIISVNGEYGDPEITYTVRIMGKNRTVVPSDFVEYATGDWVFVTHLGTIGQKCEWVQDGETGEWKKETGISEDIEGVTWVILPIKIGNYGA